MNTDDIIDSMLTCKETDFSAIMSLNTSLSNHPDVRQNEMHLVKNIAYMGNLVRNHSIGEGILVGENENGLIDCMITYGLADYSYMSNNGYYRDSNYKTLMIDLVGRIKDGEITLLDLFLRRNTGPVDAIETELEYVLTHGDNETVLKAVDKYDLSSMMELTQNEDGDEESILDWYDKIYGVLPRCNKVVGNGRHTLITLCKLYDTVTKTMFDEIEDVIDDIFNDTLIYLSIEA